MRLLYVSSGKDSLSYLDPNFISTFRLLAHSIPNFHFEAFIPIKEHIQHIFRKIQDFKPDVVLVFRASLPNPVVRQIRNLKLPVGLWIVDDPYNVNNHTASLQHYDFMVTQDSSCVPHYQNLNKPSIFLPLGVNPEHYKPMEVGGNYKYDICFIGSAMPERLNFFDRLTPFLLKKNFIIIGRWWERLRNFHSLRPHIMNQTIPPTEAAKFYNGAKIVLNIHRSNNDINQNTLNLPAYTPNNRTFDIAACRAFQLLSCRRDMDKLYEPEKEMVCFNDISDLKQKINYYLKNDDERKQIANLAYIRTMKNHTYKTRLQELIELLNSQILNYKGK